MAIQPKARNIAYRCPTCGTATIGLVGKFAFLVHQRQKAGTEGGDAPGGFCAYDAVCGDLYKADIHGSFRFNGQNLIQYLGRGGQTAGTVAPGLPLTQF